MLYDRLGDDVRLCKRATVGALVGLSVSLAWAMGYAALHGTDGLPLAAHLARWMFNIGCLFMATGVICAFAVHILRERNARPGA
jgi:hypothetical protein